ncbi:Fanconi anemia group M protein [Morus notabilis]|uniref:Fanconi anemia group M protein n=1 Tax=Morus notabilis TaxID=981085 RepID=W9QIM7_9ROSA|nr:Fanconi anemia group M protein [Morus notabilis]
MNSTVNLIDDDDDGIDWVAACEEIDVVFQNRNLPSTSSSSSSYVKPTSFVPRDDSVENKKRNGTTSKQSTLDKFVFKAVPRPPPPIPDVPKPVDEKVPRVEIDPEAAKTWIYPGLGKTLIAAVVMYNYFRWFPDGKIVFAAPSRPLVTQQIEACHNIVGIPQDLIIDMTGQITPSKRASFWKSKRVFFVTPQVLEKDIQYGRCLAKHLVCLVIDEAHRALGNYASSGAVRELMAVPVELRILALTATPGSKQQTIQQIFDNLRISTLEYRNESDEDVRKYVHNRKIELIQVPMGQDAVEINDKLLEVIRPHFLRLRGMQVLHDRDYKTLSPCELLNSREKFRQAPPQHISDIDCGVAEGLFGILLTLYHIRKLLSSHGIRPAHEMLEDKLKQGYFARYLSKNQDLFKAKLIMEQSLNRKALSPKLSKMLEVLLDHFSGFNVIVATSIGEEGLDIMEVDLVICFDANISPLRMIQRMGRTGRKHDGRVDILFLYEHVVTRWNIDLLVLTCEGPELKGYMRKQANSKTVGKHMRNGGRTSFHFHPSPRMVPHIYKPEVQYVELSIEHFIRSGKKVKDDDQRITPVLREKLTEAESNLIAKYFYPSGGIKWKPSLIAFPYFQTFPSRVHNVRHSYKTGLLIDVMQRLEGRSFGGDSKISPIKDEVSLEKDPGVGNVEKREIGEDLLFVDKFSNQNLEGKLLDSAASPRTETSETKEKPSVCAFPQQSPDGHSYYFGPDYISVDAFGNVLILSVPLLTFKEVSHPKHTSERNCLKQVSWHLNNVEVDKDLPVQAGALEDLITSQTRCPKDGSPRSICDSDALQEKGIHGIERVPQTPIKKGNLEDEDSITETPDSKIKALRFLPDEYCNESRDIELSPRLTNMIISGVVPESPVNIKGLSPGKEREYIVADPVSPVQFYNELPLKSSTPEKNDIVNIESNACGRNASASPINGAVQTPLLCKDNSASVRGCTSTSPILGKSESPFTDLTNESCSRNWCLSMGDQSESVKRTRKFKRLRKVGDDGKNENLQREKDSSLKPRASGRGRKKPNNDMVRAFIDEEAEASTDCDTSEDEEDDQNNNSHDSFIDDRTCPTIAATQSATSGTDMMAIYRRSLLSQSPMPRLPSGSDTLTTPNSMAPTPRTSERGSGSGKASFCLQTPLTDSTNQSKNSRDSKPSFRINHKTEAVPCSATSVSSKCEGDNVSKKRKLSFCTSSSVPTINLEQEFQRECEMVCDNDDDDNFFDSIDLDAFEAQATLLLKQKSELLTTQKQEVIMPAKPESPGFDFPSFDLGI